MNQTALRYHQRSPAGKISVQPTKPCRTQVDLSLAYTPGVAEPARIIARSPAAVYEYTNRSNLVAVVSNGTAALGLGKVGPLAAKPVMEGKSVLFKRFAGIDAFDLEVNCTTPEQLIDWVVRLEPSVGGVNLEDIAAPDCFVIEQAIQRRVQIPIFHDDQHGTAIVSGAALLNALALTGKDIRRIKVVIAGAGAAGVRCAEHYVRLGVPRSHIWMFDRTGLLTQQRRSQLHPLQKQFCQKTAVSFPNVFIKADVFLGVSTGNIVTPKMVQQMAPNPIVFALANPDSEIPYPVAKRARHDILIATGRSDWPNQINNVLGFPAVFRGTLDVRARQITDHMKLAATYALANLAQQPVPASVLRAYRLRRLSFSRDYILPKPFDPRVLVEVAGAVAQAAQADGVATVEQSSKRYRAYLTRLSHSL